MGYKPGSKPAPLETGHDAPKAKKPDQLEEVKERLTPDQLNQAKAKFKEYDKDGK